MTNWTHDWTLKIEVSINDVPKTFTKTGRATSRQRASLRMLFALREMEGASWRHRTSDFKVITRKIEGPDQPGFGECQICGVLQKITTKGVLIAHNCWGGFGHEPFGKSVSAFPAVIADFENDISHAVAKREAVIAEAIPIQVPSFTTWGDQPITRDEYTQWLESYETRKQTLDRMNRHMCGKFDTFDHAKAGYIAKINSRIDTLNNRLAVIKDRQKQSALMMEAK